MPATNRMTYRNGSDAFLGELGRVAAFGALATPRGEETMELVGEAFTIRYPLERFVVVPHRGNSPFAAIAESVWVLAGRNDIEFLGNYLPRAEEFSDDGITWRGGYGPRLRDWDGVDQVQEILTLLTDNPSSRRAVMSIFDPKRDFAESKDIPCNNWLHWMVRDGVLDLCIAVRSNDVVWGFSGINTFEWSFLQECMAHWLGVGVGQQHWFVSSMHAYAKHWDRAEQILSGSSGRPNLYAMPRRQVRFETAFDNLDKTLNVWFELESRIRQDSLIVTDEDLGECADPLLRAFLAMLRAYCLRDAGRPVEEVVPTLDELAGTDLHAAALEWLNRGLPQKEPIAGRNRTTEPVICEPVGCALNSHIAGLHTERDASYQDSWKKRGEQMGILANIARKVDRLGNVITGAPEYDERLFDTALDAFVYSLKYCTYLLDLDPQLKRRALGDGFTATPASDGVAAFNVLLMNYSSKDVDSSPSQVARELELALSTAEAMASKGASVGERLGAAERLSQLSYALTTLVAPPELVGEAG